MTAPGLTAADVMQIIRADPAAYTEAYLICAGTLWHRHDITGLDKADDMLIVNAGPSGPSPAVTAGAGRQAAAPALGEALHGLAVSRAAREHGIGLHRPSTVTSALLGAALDGVDWDAVGSKFLAATLAQLDYQTRREAEPAAVQAAA